MIRLIVILTTFACIPRITHAQGEIDTIKLDQLVTIDSITEIYSLPHSRYTLETFVFVRKSAHIDPYVQYNKGAGLSDASRLFLNSVKPGDTIIIKEVYALNSEAPGSGAVRFPQRMFIVK